jgi:hypothetical protein
MRSIRLCIACSYPAFVVVGCALTVVVVPLVELTSRRIVATFVRA